MKRLFLSILSVVAINTMVSAQEESTNNEIKTLFGNPNVQSIGGYGSLSTGYTKINKLDGIYFGGRGAVVINHAFALGIGGNGFISEPVKDVNLTEDYEFAGGYGGVIFEPIIGGRQPIHLSFPILVGAGGIGYVKHWGNYEDNSNYDYQNNNEDNEAFFVFEPGVELELNVVKFMRVAISGSYRYTSNINMKYKEDSGLAFAGTSIGSGDMLRGFNVGLIMKFGKF